MSYLKLIDVWYSDIFALIAKANKKDNFATLWIHKKYGKKDKKPEDWRKFRNNKTKSKKNLITSLLNTDHHPLWWRGLKKKTCFVAFFQSKHVTKRTSFKKITPLKFSLFAISTGWLSFQDYVRCGVASAASSDIILAGALWCHTVDDVLPFKQIILLYTFDMYLRQQPFI